MKALTLYLIRHAQSEANAGGISKPERDISLSPLGREQAQALVARLPRSAHIYTSELRRTHETAAPYCRTHGITPQTIQKKIDDGLRSIIPQKESDKKPKLDLKKIPKDEYPTLIKELTGQMELHSANLEFEKAAELRDLIAEIRQTM